MSLLLISFLLLFLVSKARAKVVEYYSLVAKIPFLHIVSSEEYYYEYLNFKCEQTFMWNMRFQEVLTWLESQLLTKVGENPGLLALT